MNVKKVYLLPCVVSFILFVFAFQMTLFCLKNLRIEEAQSIEGINWMITKFLGQIWIFIIYIVFSIIFASIAIACCYKAFSGED